MSTRPIVPNRSFQSIRVEWERLVFWLKNTHDPERRKTLLREVRLLIEEADAIIASEPEFRG
jgi:hypothetical protein